jgi:hypothetical protein
MLSQKSPIPPPHSPTHPLPLLGPGLPQYWGIYSLKDQGASLSNDGQLGHILLHKQLETWALGCTVSSYCCSTYRVADPFSSLGTFSSSSIGGSVIQPIADCEHPLLCLLGPSIASQETALSQYPGALDSTCICIKRWPSWPSLEREAHWTCKLYMPQYRGTPGPKGGSGWVREWEGGSGGLLG